MYVQSKKCQDEAQADWAVSAGRGNPPGPGGFLERHPVHQIVDGSFNQLTAIREIKQSQIEKYFAEREGDMGVLMETVGTLRKEAFGKLEAIQASKKAQLERFFAERMGDALVLADNPFVHQAFKALDAAFEAAGGATGGRYKGHTNEKYDAPASYRAVYDRYFPTFKYYMEQYGYYK